MASFWMLQSAKVIPEAQNRRKDEIRDPMACLTFLQMLTRRDEALLNGRNTFFILDLVLDILNIVARLHLQSDGFA
jgi:hypothetical protein